MIKVKLDQLAKKINKSITDIAKETKLNRNTITALYHNKVDGIKFATLERICDVYKVGIGDLLGFENIISNKLKKEAIYKQEGAAVPLTCWPWLLASTRINKQFLDYNYGNIYFYSLKEYIEVYWDKEALRKVAVNVYEKYADKKNLDIFFNNYLKAAEKLKEMYLKADQQVILSFTNNQLEDYFKQLMETYADMWDNALFVDSFDPGYDQEKIAEIVKKYELTKEDVQILTTSEIMTFNSKRLYEVLKAVKKIKNKNISSQDLEKFIEEDEDIKKYILNYDYYLSNYAQISHINRADLILEIKKYLKDDKLFQEEFYKLDNFTKIQQTNNLKVLKKYKLTENPLYFFSLLTYWRENRKQVNLMGFHVFDLILESLEEKTGIEKKYLKYLVADEISHVLKGGIDLETLKKRRETGCLFIFKNGDYQMLMGKQADSLKNEFENRLNAQADLKIIPGQVACQGYARGIARIILNEKDFNNLKPGEILVTGMTRPEFIPIMKRAAAIVTNEGGITCHAAIVSRELGIPCIIGTGNATQLIKDGDLVEVRANHGTVRILS